MNEPSKISAVDIVNQLTQWPKFYAWAKPPIKHSTAYRIISSIKNGTCKPETERKFLSAFGYEVAQEVLYVRKDVDNG